MLCNLRHVSNIKYDRLEGNIWISLSNVEATVLENHEPFIAGLGQSLQIIYYFPLMPFHKNLHGQDMWNGT